MSWFSDEGGEYALVVADQYGNDRRNIALENPTFYYTPRWSPDSRHLAFGDADRNLWVLDVESGKTQRVANEGFAHPQRLLEPVWSPDSRWLAYSRRLPNEFNAVFVYSLDSGEATQVTDGLSDCHGPAWDRDGKHLYFLASTDFGMNVGWLDMSSINLPLNYAIYVAVLDASAPSPLAPQSDDETPAAEADQEDGADAGETPTVAIDFAALDQRILALGVPTRPYSALRTGEQGVLFYQEQVPNEPGFTLHRYILADREAKVVTKGIEQYVLSADGKKLLLAQPENTWVIADAAGEPTPGEGVL